MTSVTRLSFGLLFAALHVACSAQSGTASKSSPAGSPAAEYDGTIHPDIWPSQDSVMVRDAAMEQRIVDLMARMTVEEKVGQVIQADIASVTPAEVRDYNLGSVLNGGSSAPGGDNRTTADKWLALADEFWIASTDTSDGGVGIPAIWGTDAVHGHSNVTGATLFPHNIGLGMANDPDMMYDIGQATAIEMLVTGLDWTFAPTIAVARNDRWGRTYESYSEDPRIVAAYGPRVVEGIQGVVGSDEFLSDNHMLATAKHFAGDGGTTGGRDQGDTQISEEQLRDQQAAAYPPVIAAGVQSVMASFNTFHGRKMHGHKEMLTDVLVGRMGFDGFVVGDWNGHGQVVGCTKTSCAASINAGLDMFMAPGSWKELYVATLEQVGSGEITKVRLDEAVARILRVKIRGGVLDAGIPSGRPYAGEFALLGSAEHRAIARNAVRKSMVLLKNEDGLLPLGPALHVLIAGDGAHSIGKQSGGWSLNWQGTDNLNEHFPNGDSIYDGLRDAIEAGGGKVVLSEDGSFTEKPDVAIVVFGENPYAEFQGDRPSVNYDSDDGLVLLRMYQDAGIATVSVFISGRPMWVNPELNASNAFVAAWLPGTEGGGIADVLVGSGDGSPRFDFAGRLSFSWPKMATQVDVNVGDADYAPLFGYGYGLSYADGGTVAQLSEESGLGDIVASSKNNFFEFGDPVGSWGLVLRDAGGDRRIGYPHGVSAGGNLNAVPADREVQEDSVVLTWTDAASLVIEGGPVDFVRETNGDMSIELTYQILAVSAQTISVEMGRGVDWRGAIDVSAAMAELAGTGWRTSLLRLSCFADQGLQMASITEPLVITANGPLTLQLASARIVGNPGDADCDL